MSRNIQINGPVMVSVKGRVDSPIGTLTQLGLSESAVVVTPIYHHDDIIVDANGPAVGVDEQIFLAEARISMALVHYDPAVLTACLALAMANSTGADGSLPGAGSRMGGGLARFAAGNNYIGLNLASPIGNLPWCFLYSKLDGQPATWPLGTKRSVVQLNWRAIAYSVDPWNNGLGSLGQAVWTHVLDS